MARKGYADVLEKDPTKSVPREEQIGRSTKKLDESERRALANQIAQREEEILAKKDMSRDADVSEMQREIQQKKMILQHDDDLRPKTDGQRDRLYARAKEIEGIIVKEMPTKREMWPKPGSAESQQAVRHNLKFQENRSDLCREWQDIQNKLNPDDPGAASLELIRPD
jgi:hypothetical protein